MRAVLTVEETLDTSTARKPAGAGCPAHRSRARFAVALILAVACVFTLSACGGEEQSAGAPTGTWQASVLEWKFPKEQPLGTPVDFVLKIRNDDERAIPEVVVTISGLKTKVAQPGAGSEVRPVWLPNEVNYANVTPYNAALATTYNLGSLASGDTKTYKLPLTPLRRGEHQVGYTLAAGLYGGARIVGDDDQTLADNRIVAIDPTPKFDRSFFDD